MSEGQEKHPSPVFWQVIDKEPLCKVTHGWLGCQPTCSIFFSVILNYICFTSQTLGILLSKRHSFPVYLDCGIFVFRCHIIVATKYVLVSRLFHMTRSHAVLLTVALLILFWQQSALLNRTTLSTLYFLSSLTFHQFPVLLDV